MNNQGEIQSLKSTGNSTSHPNLVVDRIGIVARDYNKCRDFSGLLPELLKLLDEQNAMQLFFRYMVLIR